MTHFDPNRAASENSGIFGLPYGEAESKVIYVPVPWELTTSYGQGTAQGPQAILKASRQVDLYHPELKNFYEQGLHMLPIPSDILALNTRSKNESNILGEQVNNWVYAQTKRLLEQNKLVGIIGGDHSSPFGAIGAVSEREENFGILHLDAHADTRQAYEGHTWSHASIMRNVIEQIPQVSKLAQIGIRDFCEEEYEFAKLHEERVHLFTDFELLRAKFEGKTWALTSNHVISNLPEKVWVSLDIDVLDPRFCPGTGTPVPGGLDFQQVYYLFSALVHSGRQIIGFDLCEVGSGEWDGNVGARMLYHLTGWMLESQQRI